MGATGGYYLFNAPRESAEGALKISIARHVATDGDLSNGEVAMKTSQGKVRYRGRRKRRGREVGRGGGIVR